MKNEWEFGDSKRKVKFKEFSEETMKKGEKEMREQMWRQ